MKFRTSKSCFLHLLSVPALGSSIASCSSRDGGIAQCATAGDNATTVHQLGLDALSRAVGRSIVAWKEIMIAPMLASIGEGDYGEITRLELTFGAAVEGALASDALSIIVKRFIPKPTNKVGPGAVNVTEHQRFLKGFQVEAAAYSSLGTELEDAGLKIPRVLHATEVQPGMPFAMLLEDLSVQYPRGAGGRARRMEQQELSAALYWLAAFHASFWEQPRAVERGLWPRGSYWILDDLGLLELTAVPVDFENRYIAGSEFRRLRRASEAIDARLEGKSPSGAKALAPRHRTLIHGDAKPENILCSARSHVEAVTCTFIDFAWTGEGYGMYDLMYLLWGEYTQKIVDRHLDDYRTALLRRLPPASGEAYTPLVMRQHFELCVLDFVRWWAGFKNGEYFWAMPWAMTTVREVLERLDGGKLLSKEEYAAAVDREFPMA